MNSILCGSRIVKKMKRLKAEKIIDEPNRIFFLLHHRLLLEFSSKWKSKKTNKVDNHEKYRFRYAGGFRPNGKIQFAADWNFGLFKRAQHTDIQQCGWRNGFAKRDDAGVSVKSQRFDCVFHEFFGLAGAVSKAKEAVTLAADGLKEVFDIQNERAQAS